jgi:hypothetical protein
MATDASTTNWWVLEDITCPASCGHGTCTIGSPNYCTCDDGYYGTGCDLIKCFGTLSNDANVCTGHGTCSSTDHCSCSSDYTGINCQLPICFGVNSTSSTVCSGRYTVDGFF